MTVIESSLEQLPPSAKLESLHDQVEGDQVEVENDTFEPLIAGDFPVSISKRAPKKEEKKKENFDLSSESVFPSLSSSSGPRSPAVSCWSSATSRVKSQPTHNIKPTVTSPIAPTAKKTNVTQITDLLEITADKQIANLPEKPANFKGNTQIIQDVMSRTGTNIIASTNLSGTSTYLIQGASSDVARAKFELKANIAIKS